MNKSDLSPVRSSERYVILDALRGFALLGIAMANFPEFSLYTFMSAEDTATLPLSGVDQWVRYLLYFFVDGKFYTIFSKGLALLFCLESDSPSFLKMLHEKEGMPFPYFTGE